MVDTIGLLVVLVGSLVATSPLLPPGQLLTHDATGHLYRLMDFDLAFRAGNLWPRIAPHLAQDFGYATFTFYSPLSLYMGEAFRLIGLGYVTSLKAVFALSIFGSGFGAYLFTRELYGTRGAVAAGLVYVFLPYRLLDVYTRGDLAESIGLAILPAVFWGFWRVGQRPSTRNAIVAGCTLAGLVVAHNLTALFAMPLLLGFILVSIGRGWSVPRLIGLGIAGLVALLVSAAYWVPVMIESGSINTQALTEGFFDYHQRFFTLGNLVQRDWAYDYSFAPNQGIVFNFSPVQAAAIGVATVWILVTSSRNRRVVVACVVAIVFLLWMEQDGSAWLWDRLPFVRFLQFPYRLTIYVTLATSVVLGSLAGARCQSTISAASRRPRDRVGEVGGIVLAIVSVGAISIAAMWQIPRVRTSDQEIQVNLPNLWRVEQDRELIATSTQADFIPQWTKGNIYRPTAEQFRTLPLSADVRPPIVTAQMIGPLELNATVEALGPSRLIFDRIYYLSWQATVDGQPAPLTPEGPLGLISLEVPHGIHQIHLSADGTPLERAGLWVSIASVSAIAVYSVWPKRKRGVGRLIGAGVLMGLVALAVSNQLHPPVQLAGGETFGSSVRLVGSALNQAIDSSGAADVTLLWESLGKVPPSCETHLRLLDQRGQVVARRDKVPLFGLRPCALWQDGVLIRDESQIRLPPGAAAGSYRLAVGFSGDGRPFVPGSPSKTVEWRDDDGSLQRGLLLGTIDVPSFSDSKLTLVGSPVEANIADKFQLETAKISIGTIPADDRGPDRRFAARIHAGDQVSVDLLWRSLADVSEDYSVFAHLIGPDESVVAQDDAWPHRFNFPTSAWFPGDRRRDSYQLVVPETIDPGVYRLVAGFYNRADQARLKVISGGIPGEQVLLGRFKVADTGQTFGQPFSADARHDLLGGTIALNGVQVTATELRPSGLLHVGLVWKAIQRPTTDYTVFVHVLGEHDKVVAQVDSAPLNGSFPTSDWDVGDTIYDSRDIPLPKDLKPGNYAVEIGLYDAKSGSRLSATNGETSIRFGSMVVSN